MRAAILLALIVVFPGVVVSQTSPSPAPRAAPTPCLSRPESRSFDFWVGEWDVTTPQGQPAGSSSVQLLLQGCTLFENWHSLAGVDGKSLESSYNRRPGRGGSNSGPIRRAGSPSTARASGSGDTLRFTAHSTHAARSDDPDHELRENPSGNTVRQWGAVSMRRRQDVEALHGICITTASAPRT